MKPGTLVRSCAIRASSRKGVIHLTPVTVISNPEFEDWPEWKPNEVGIVLPPGPNQLGLLVMIPDGIGLCFHDEVREIQ